MLDQIKQNLTNKQALSLINQIEQPFKSLPHLPKALTDFLVMLTPWLVLIGGVLNLISGVSGFLNPSRNSAIPFGQASANIKIFILFTNIALTITGALLLLAFQPLQAKKYQGWVYLFWANFVNIVLAIAGVVLLMSGVVGAAIGILIGLYLMFEIKPYYKKAKSK